MQTCGPGVGLGTPTRSTGVKGPILACPVRTPAPGAAGLGRGAIVGCPTVKVATVTGVAVARTTVGVTIAKVDVATAKVGPAPSGVAVPAIAVVVACARVDVLDTPVVLGAQAPITSSNKTLSGDRSDNPRRRPLSLWESQEMERRVRALA